MTNEKLLDAFIEATVQFEYYSNSTEEAAFVAARDAILARLNALDGCVEALELFSEYVVVVPDEVKTALANAKKAVAS